MIPAMNRKLLWSVSACVPLLLLACSQESPAPKAAVQAVKPAAPVTAAQPEAKPVAVSVPAPVQSKASPDHDLAARVKKALDAEHGAIAQSVDVSASGGAVRLWGAVASRAERSAAEKIAAKTPGVTSVDNQLVVVRGS
jgi:osmotically-inducible protein OsmY